MNIYKSANKPNLFVQHTAWDQGKSEDDEIKAFRNFFQENSDVISVLINLIGLVENEKIAFSDEDLHFLDALLNDQNYSYHALKLLNKISAFQDHLLINVPFFLFDHLFCLLKGKSNNLLLSTIGNFISKSEIFAEFAIENNMIQIFIQKYSNEQQDMIPWITLCFLSHQKISIIQKVYPLINYIMQNMAIIVMNTEKDLHDINNFIRLGYHALTDFITKTQNFSYFSFNDCFPRNATLQINDGYLEKYNFVYEITKNTQKIPKNFPYINFYTQSMNDLLNQPENIALIIVKCIYNISLKHIFIEHIIQSGLFNLLQEIMISAPFQIKKTIVKIMLELIVNTSLIIQILDILNPQYFDIIQDFLDIVDENKCARLISAFHLISNEKHKLQIKQLLDSIIQSQDGEMYFQNEQDQMMDNDE